MRGLSHLAERRQRRAHEQGLPAEAANDERVTLRRIPGALGLGLVAALIGHAVVYGNGHAMGGDYHELLLKLALAGSLALLGALAALATAGARFVADGSILARRVAQVLPNFPALLAATAAWYSLGEAIEPQHAAASILLVALALALAAALLLVGARTLVDSLSAAVVAVVRLRFAGRRPTITLRRRRAPLAIPAPPSLRRRLVRPPPTIARAF